MIGEIIAIVLGLGVGLSLGALGGGGSTLAVPILVFIAGMSAQGATSASLLVVGVASAIGAVGHYRNGYVRLRSGLAFGAAGIAGSRVGTLVNRSLPEKVLLLAFSALILFVAIRMLKTAKRAEQSRPSLAGSTPTTTTLAASPAANVPLDGGLVTEATVATDATPTLDLSPRSIVKLVAAASVVGLLTGLFGVGGGFAVVPALTLLLGFSTKDAIGTSLVVISINTAIALGMRAGNLDFDWTLILPFLATVTAGVLIGSRVANTIDAARLTKSFAIMLTVVAFYTAGGAILS